MAGIAVINVRVAKIEKMTKVYVANDLTEDVILFMDFLEDNQCIVDYEAMTLSAGGGVVSLEHNQGTVYDCNVCLLETLKIHANTEVSLPCKINSISNFEQNDVFIERCPSFFQKYEVLTAVCVSRAIANVVGVRLASHVGTPKEGTL
uniref:uncharacterized protein LOC113475644 n=1 Tax=Ciona intestinalis TaxID=7719 RepID=UPI000EF50393|nr:uncharacterized protein LOC113475644 [Ciona intestinalis]|eukprot:XP_026695860.1 uncharacterized protein LOC113475644 [Ciona intestinalis]